MSHHFEVVPPRAELVLHVLEDEREVGNTVDLAVDYSDSCSVPEADPSSTFAAAEEDKWNDVPAEVVVPVLEHASHGSAPASDQLGGPAVPGMPPNPTESDPAASSIAFDPMTVLAMHYQLNEKPFMLLQQGTEVSQFSEDDFTRCASSFLECTICLDAIESGQLVTKVPCEGGHKFHHECLNRFSPVSSPSTLSTSLHFRSPLPLILTLACSMIEIRCWSKREEQTR
eukprot:3561183-Rhodomonas_salina.1